MKNILIFALLISGTTFSQTNIIAAKSHASSHAIDKNESDNFGNPVVLLPISEILTVEYLKADCIVEKRLILELDTETYDTICDHPFLKPGQVRIERIKAMYPSGTEFIGFEELNSDEGRLIPQSRKDRRSNKSSALWLLIIGGGMFLTYLFVPKFTIKTT